VLYIECAILVSFVAVGALQLGSKDWREPWEPVATKGTPNYGQHEYCLRMCITRIDRLRL